MIHFNYFDLVVLEVGVYFLDKVAILLPFVVAVQVLPVHFSVIAQLLGVFSDLTD